jgi:hypothetical protein
MASRVTCLSESTIVGLLERGLPGEQRAEVERTSMRARAAAGWSST